MLSKMLAFKKTGVMVSNAQIVNTPLIPIPLYDLCNLV